MPLVSGIADSQQIAEKLDPSPASLPLISLMSLMTEKRGPEASDTWKLRLEQYIAIWK